MSTNNTIQERLRENGVHIYNQDVLQLYDKWEQPDVIISDGAYGVSGFKGDAVSHSELEDWYGMHIDQWTKRSRYGTTLWLWNTEIGFATLHPILEKSGWDFLGCNIWNKGIQHIAGNCNLRLLKTFPIVTEVCAQYYKRPEFCSEKQKFSLKDWLRIEWSRTGLPIYKANLACGISNAASRKYLTKDHLWYAPPPDHFERMLEYANKFGKPSGRPYFSVNGTTSISKDSYVSLFPYFQGKYGVTNVWNEPPLHSKERIRASKSTKYFHLNQKPLRLMELLVLTSSIENQVVWEPFGGLMTASLVAYLNNRKAYAAEINRSIFQMAIERFGGINLTIDYSENASAS